MIHTLPQRCLLVLLAAGVPLSASAAQDDGSLRRAPVASRNTAPIYANLGIPTQRDAGSLGAGAWQLGWQLHWASHSVRERSGELALEMDGETRRHDLSLRLGLGRGVTVEATVPWIRHEGGSLDSLIEGWHELWGLPNGARDDQPDDVLRFAYNGPRGFLLNSEASGVGDIELGIAWTMGTIAGADWASFAQVKLATGDAEVFTGSGGTAYAAGMRASLHACGDRRLSCHVQLGYALTGDIAFAPDADEGSWFAGLSLAWALGEHWALIGQLDAQAEIFAGDPLATAGAPVWGTLGARWTPAGRGDNPGKWAFEAHFSEDLAVGAAPDITFLLSASRRF
jgi:hypothetical protein